MGKLLLKLLSFAGLLLTIVPSIMVFYGYTSLQQSKNMMVWGVLIWFLTAPFWLNKSLKDTI